MRYFRQDEERDCLPCCVASLLDVEPYRLPSNDGYLNDFNLQLEQRFGRTLVGVDPREIVETPCPWIPVEKRSDTVGHAVLAVGRDVVWDPACGVPWRSRVWLNSLMMAMVLVDADAGDRGIQYEVIRAKVRQHKEWAA
jgi:hypothetical protein